MEARPDDLGALPSDAMSASRLQSAGSRSCLPTLGPFPDPAGLNILSNWRSTDTHRPTGVGMLP